MRVMMDIDGVIRDLSVAWRKAYYEEFGNPLPVSATYYGLYDDMIAHSNGIITTKGEAKEWLYNEYSYYIFTSAPPIWDMHHVACNINLAFDLWLVTRQPNQKCLAYTYQWLLAHNLIPKSIVQTSQKWEVPADVYIDDSPDNIMDLLIHSPPESVVCIYDRPYNQEPLPGGGRFRYRSRKALRVFDGNEFWEICKDKNSALNDREDEYGYGT